MILALSDRRWHDVDHEVPVSCIFGARNLLLMKPNAQELLEHGLDR